MSQESYETQRLKRIQENILELESLGIKLDKTSKKVPNGSKRLYKVGNIAQNTISGARKSKKRRLALESDQDSDSTFVEVSDSSDDVSNTKIKKATKKKSKFNVDEKERKGFNQTLRLSSREKEVNVDVTDDEADDEDIIWDDDTEGEDDVENGNTFPLREELRNRSKSFQPNRKKRNTKYRSFRTKQKETLISLVQRSQEITEISQDEFLLDFVFTTILPVELRTCFDNVEVDRFIEVIQEKIIPWISEKNRNMKITELSNVPNSYLMHPVNNNSLIESWYSCKCKSLPYVLH